MKRGNRKTLAATVVLAAVLLACGEGADDNGPAGDDGSGDAAADDEPAEDAPSGDDAGGEPQVDFSGETITLMVGFSAGGGFDLYGRTIARYLEEELPGNPTVIVENVPGAGSRVAATQLYEAAPNDGSTFAHFLAGRVALEEALGLPDIPFETQAFGYIGSPVPDSFTCAVSASTGVTSVDDIRGDDGTSIVIGTHGSPDTATVRIVELLDLNVDIVGGYAGIAEVRVAVEQGEVDGGCWSWETMGVDWAQEIADGDIVPLMQAMDEPHPDIPDVPLIRDQAPDDLTRQAVEYGLDLPSEIARAFALPPDAPAEVVEAYREAFDRVMTDEEFLAEADELGLPILPISGPDMEAAVENIQNMPDDVRDVLAELFGGQ